MADDFSVLLAVVRANSLSGAARVLKVSHTTVSRRLRELEKTLGAKLIELRGNQLVLTQHGEDAARVAMRLEDEIWRLTRRVSQEDNALIGDIRLATVDFLAVVYASKLQAFSRDNPGVKIDILTSTDTVSIARGDADIALRLGDPGDDSLVGRVVDRLSFGVYGHRRDLVEADHLNNRAWVVYSGRGCGRYTEPWRDRTAPNGRIAAKVATPLVMAEMIRSGIGIGLLPQALGAASTDLVFWEAAGSFEVDVWLVVTEAARQDLRVRAFLDHF